MHFDWFDLIWFSLYLSFGDDAPLQKLLLQGLKREKKTWRNQARGLINPTVARVLRCASRASCMLSLCIGSAIDELRALQRETDC